MPSPIQPFYTFSPAFFERIWGGKRIASDCGLDAPTELPIGEAWLLSDHPHCESVICDGPATGASLHDLVTEHEEAVLGGANRLTRNGRFPLLLKILDAQDVLSVQVHPDNKQAQLLGEDDGGKTEMWYFIGADKDSYVTCGVTQGTSPETFRRACESGEVAQLLTRHGARPGQAIHIPAGTVHAIGPGCLIAEIQQNSDVTYRLYDWGRTDNEGKPRALHLDNAMQVIDLEAAPKPAAATAVLKSSARIMPLSSCPHFTAVHVDIKGEHEFTGSSAPTILLPLRSNLEIIVGDETGALRPFLATLVPAATGPFTLRGTGAVLVYSIPT